MDKIKKNLFSAGYTLTMMLAAFVTNLVLVSFFDNRSTLESVFVLAVFLVSLRTEGYFWGICASLLGVLAVNYAFTYPYWAFDLISPKYIAAAVVMLIVSITTSTLTTKLKQQEKVRSAAERERMRGNLLRAVSHDLRTPLTSIYGASSVILESFEEIPPETHRKLLEDIQEDAQWLVRMVENLLSVTRVDATQVELKKRDTVLEELVDDVLIKFRKHYPRQEVLLELPEEFISIPMDVMLIEQVLMNLLENAVLHADGMEHLWLRVTANGNQVQFSVEDDGCGIPPERLSKLFEGFLDESRPSDSSRSSMGIGLSVCSTIIRAHGGQITASNRPGGGAAFCFALRMEENHEQ